MAPRFLRYVETKLILIAASILCLCCATAHGFYAHLNGLRADTEALTLSSVRSRHLSETLSLLQDAEIGERGYLLTGRTEFLDPYRRASHTIEQSLATLNEAYARIAPAQAIVARFEEEARGKLAELTEAIALRREGGLPAAQRFVLQEAGTGRMEAIRADAKQLLDAERTLLDAVIRDAHSEAQRDMDLWLWAACTALLPAWFCLVFAFRDVRRERRESVRLSHASSHDALTGLLNRAGLLAHLEDALSRCPGEVGLLYIDLDGFKPINDELGHAAGDEVLVAVARCLKDSVRPDDAVGRMGGDEFVVVVAPCPSRESLEGMSERVEAAMAIFRLPALGGRCVRGSIGTAYSAEDGPAATALLASADAQMYARKASLRHAETPEALHRLFETAG